MRAPTAEMAMRQAQKDSAQQLVDGLRALYDADSRLKSGSGDDRAVMEFLVAGWYGAQRPAAQRRSLRRSNLLLRESRRFNCALELH